MDFPQLSRLHALYRGSNLFDPSKSVRPRPGSQHYDSQLSACKVLLVPHILISGYQQRVAFALSNLKQLSVAQFRPSLPSGSFHHVSGEEVPERPGSPLVKQDSQHCSLARVP